ncbi:MAG TPA: Arc family DNA-binding protein [Planctomycetota bacterium]
MADDKKGFLLRLPPRLFEELRRWAEQDMRSINGQIEWLLQQALRQRLGRDPNEPPPPKKK